MFLGACGGGGGGNSAASNEPAPAPTRPPLRPRPPTRLPDRKMPNLTASEELAKAEANGNLHPPSEHEIAACAYADRNRLRFFCPGSDACIVAIDAAGGQARVEAGKVRFARVVVAPLSNPTEPKPEPTPPVAMPEPESEPTPPAPVRGHPPHRT